MGELAAKTGIALRIKLYRMAKHLREIRKNECGQGTTEYAILVGVLVVIAIVAVTLFKDKLQELWTAIADGINSL